jgi:hypothetical protein
MALRYSAWFNLCDIMAHFERGAITAFKRNPLSCFDLRLYPIPGMAKAAVFIVKRRFSKGGSNP